jgi:hypothetical protein
MDKLHKILINIYYVVSILSTYSCLHVLCKRYLNCRDNDVRKKIHLNSHKISSLFLFHKGTVADKKK